MTIVTYEEFKRLDMRVVQVRKADSISGKTRILKLEIDIGGGETRTIVVGGAQFYKPGDFIGKKFIGLVNLAPRIVGSIESQGMILATETEKPLWLSVDQEAPVGSRIL
ncbi:tRNA-binding protein [Candidatus Bathyarchaeota archaeon]|nr:tRNA-binding protein [Candidatus Bathyarchaeota archaeon]